MVALVAVMAVGCTSAGDPQTSKLRKFTVDFSWQGVQPCTNVSPRIDVRGAPPGTRRFKVELVDIDSMISRHGGGEVPADPSGVIPAGALKNYRGPCPSQQAIRYEMRVAALDENGNVLARAADRQLYDVRTLVRRGQR